MPVGPTMGKKRNVPLGEDGKTNRMFGKKPPPQEPRVRERNPPTATEKSGCLNEHREKGGEKVLHQEGFGRNAGRESVLAQTCGNMLGMIQEPGVKIGGGKVSSSRKKNRRLGFFKRRLRWGKKRTNSPYPLPSGYPGGKQRSKIKKTTKEGPIAQIYMVGGGGGVVYSLLVYWGGWDVDE